MNEDSRENGVVSGALKLAGIGAVGAGVGLAVKKGGLGKAWKSFKGLYDDVAEAGGKVGKEIVEQTSKKKGTVSLNHLLAPEPKPLSKGATDISDALKQQPSQASKKKEPVSLNNLLAPQPQSGTADAEKPFFVNKSQTRGEKSAATRRKNRAARETENIEISSGFTINGKEI